MAKQPPTRHLRVVIFDDEPAELLEAVSGLKIELARQNVQIHIQVYRVDWYYQARLEIEMHANRAHADRIPMLWITDLQQKYQLDDKLSRESEQAIDDLGFETRNTVNELTKAVASAGINPGNQMTPDGVAVIALAKRTSIPFMVASVYTTKSPTRELLARLAKGDATANANTWEIPKGDLYQDRPGRERLKAVILEYASPVTVGGFDIRDMKRWYKDPAFWVGLAIPTIIAIIALYYQKQEVNAALAQLREAQMQAERGIVQPSYKDLKLTFTVEGKKPVEWDLLGTNIPKEVPVRGNVNTQLLAELQANECYQQAMLYKLGVKEPQLIPPRQGRIDTNNENSSLWHLEPGFYLVLLHSKNQASHEKDRTTDLVRFLKEETESLRRKVGELTGGFVCDSGNVTSHSISGEGLNLLRGMCTSLHQNFELSDRKNNKVVLVAFQVSGK